MRIYILSFYIFLIYFYGDDVNITRRKNTCFYLLRHLASRRIFIPVG
ncbi:hypothetical protein EC40522_D0130 [Escherichia coli 4.0522]|uniref:Uncharacterized protein n=1 Tax=Escherichia coli TaxID=562 RepID=A0A075M9W5_ECOLX|nr:hypothetical protein [Escherichia coli]EIH78492.1 hypothetical protein EC40522_D0130 [Escherichia coli 4.0522]